MRNLSIDSCALAILLGLGVAGCDDGTAIDDFEGYGSGMPGSGLPEGGEVLLEKVYYSGAILGGQPAIVNQFYAFQYGGAFMGATKAPAPGTCFEFEHPVSFPVHDIPAEADYVDWGNSVQLSGPGIDGTLDVPKTMAPATGLGDNRPSPIRNHKEGKWIYGGTAWQGENFQSIDIAEGTYTLGIDGQEKTFFFPPAFGFSFNIGTEEVEVPRTAPAGGWEVTWDNIPNPAGQFHTREHTFVFLVFAAFPAEGDRGPDPLFLCQPPDTEDGRMVIAQDVLDAIPDAGIIQQGRLTHYMDKLDDNEGEERRFDMFAIYCAVSSYSKVD